jgi:hypothetical protein
MEVTIDGVKFIPAAPVCDNPAPLDVRMYVRDHDREMSLREYLHALLATLWDEGEGFSGKRPFGNSGWEYDVYAFLIKAGAVSGALDEDGNVDECDTEHANKIMPGLIAEALGLSKTDA